MRDNKTPYTKNQLAEITVTYSCTIDPHDRICVRSSTDAADLLRLIWDDNSIEYREQFYAVYLNRSNHVLGYFLHSIGGISGTIVDIKQILAVAIKANASSIILSHSHPSGNTRPSNADRTITKRIVNGASLLDLSVLDHIILTKHSFYSFADDGMLPSSDERYVEKIAEENLYPNNWDR